MSEEAIRIILEILARGHTVEIRRRKDEIVILEVQGKQRYRVATNG
jgi:hypothetical protein